MICIWTGARLGSQIIGVLSQPTLVSLYKRRLELTEAIKDVLSVLL